MHVISKMSPPPPTIDLLGGYMDTVHLSTPLTVIPDQHCKHKTCSNVHDRVSA